VRGGSGGFLRSLVSVGGWQESLKKIKVYSKLVAAEEGRKEGAMDALWNFGSLRRSSATLAAAEQPPLPPPPPPHPEFAETAVTTTAPQVEDQVSGNQVPESMQQEHSSNGDALLDGRESTEDQVQLAEEEEEEERLTPIRAPVSRDDDDEDDEDEDGEDDDDEEVGDGDVSFGSGESFDSALERMAASSTGSFDASSPAGSFVGAASHLDNQQQQQRKKGLGVGQQGALMRLNQMMSGESTLDTAVLEDCTEEEFKDKIQEIARSRELSPTDASISSILEALLPLVRAGGGAQGTESQEMEIKVGDNEEDEEEMTGNNEDEPLSKNNRAVEGEGGIVQAEQDEDVADDEEGIVNQEDDEAKEDLDISASVMPVAKLSADDDELIEAEDGMTFYSFSSFCSRHLDLVPVVHDVQILSLLCLKSSGTPN
jgi:hypothetical protein